MSNLSGSVGEGGGGGRAPGAFTDTGYGTHDGQGNVPTGAQYQQGTGYDEHGQVKTSFGKFQVAYDPVTGMAVDSVTAGYSFPAAGGDDVGGGLVDVSAAGTDATHATPEMQRQVQEFFENRERQGAAAPPSEGAQAPPSAGIALEETGQVVAERLDAGAYLSEEPTLTGAEAEAWRTHGGTDGGDDI